MAWRWETRGNNEYLYAAHRIDGRVVRSYLAKNGPMRQAMNVLMADRQERDRVEREAKRRASLELRERIGSTMRELASADAELRLAAEAVLAAVGYHRHERGNWRMKRTANKPGTSNGTSPNGKPQPPARPVVKYRGTPPSAPEPLIHYTPINNWIDNADDLFAAARAGDEDAQAKLRKELRANEWARNFFGDIGNRATRTIIALAAGGDAVWAIALEEKVREMTKELLGTNPTVLDQLIVRRVTNSWVTIHALELEQAINPPARPRDRAFLEAAVERANRRLVQAVSELARVRRLQLPQVLVNINSPTPPPPPLPRVATAEVLESATAPAGVSGEKLAAGNPKPGKPKQSSPRRGSRGRP